MTSMPVMIYLLVCAVLLQLLRWEYARLRAERRPSTTFAAQWAKTGSGLRNADPSRAARSRSRGCPRDGVLQQLWLL
jgi:hypothetical protein